jgi:hypothetical protein
MLFSIPFFFEAQRQLLSSLSVVDAPVRTSVPALSVPSAGDDGTPLLPLGEAVSQAAEAGVEGLRQVLSAFTASMTALGSSSNAMFAQVAAALASERAVRVTGLALTTPWRPSRQNRAQSATYASWQEAWTEPFSFSPFTAMWFGNSGRPNPWTAFTQAFDMWAGLWTCSSLLRETSYSTPSRNQSLSIFPVPGFSWGFNWDPGISYA